MIYYKYVYDKVLPSITHKRMHTAVTPPSEGRAPQGILPHARSVGTYVSGLTAERTILRMSSTPAACPAATACIIMLPMAVASAGPATTVTPVALAVHWLRRVLQLPPPMT